MNTGQGNLICGWIAVGLSVILSCFWACWGIIENFHEGWYYRTLTANMGLMFVQYLSPLAIFLAASVTAIRWPRVGGVVHLVLGIAIVWFFRRSAGAGIVLLAMPLLLLALLYWFGCPTPRSRASTLALTLPLLTLLVCGVEPAFRVASRIDDGNREACVVVGNGVRLVWAPAGPGWPDKGVNWPEAQRRCVFLTPDGKSLAPTPQNIWRLPSVDEGVRSMARHGRNCGGVWHQASRQASYEVRPDKESPLWNTHSPVIYWWTSTEAAEDRAWIIVYNGTVWPRRKSIHPEYLGFRAVHN